MVCIITGRIVYQPFSRLRLRVEWHSVDKDPLCENHVAFWFIEKRKRFVRLTFLSLQVSVSSRRGYRGVMRKGMSAFPMKEIVEDAYHILIACHLTFVLGHLTGLVPESFLSHLHSDELYDDIAWLYAPWFPIS